MVFDTGGGGPERARVICGFLGCDERPFNPLLASLPEVIHLPAATHPSASWLRSLVESAVAEARGARPGAGNVLARLSELMFVEAVRHHLETLPMEQRGWLAGLRDPIAGQVLSLLHGAPADAWTLEGLARKVGVSRSALAERFAEVVGQPPMQYLACWRMQLAARRLAAGGHVAQVAARCGLRVGGGVQPRVQEDRRGAAGRVATQAAGDASRQTLKGDTTTRLGQLTGIGTFTAAELPCQGRASHEVTRTVSSSSPVAGTTSLPTSRPRRRCPSRRTDGRRAGPPLPRACR